MSSASSSSMGLLDVQLAGVATPHLKFDLQNYPVVLQLVFQLCKLLDNSFSLGKLFWSGGVARGAEYIVDCLCEYYRPSIAGRDVGERGLIRGLVGCWRKRGV